MKNGVKKIAVIGGIIVLILVAVFSWYTVNYDEARFLVPMDFLTYSWRPQDLPMIISGVLLTLYIVYLAVLLIWAAAVQRGNANAKSRSRKINPKLGLFGLLGFLGFLGFWTYSTDKAIFPFVFFIFFGFFGFFYEGKMSNTFMDERYKENKMQAHLVANKISLTIIFIATLVLGQGKLVGNIEYTFIAYVIIISLTIAFNLFLSEYLLYHYDHDDSVDESEDRHA